MTTEWLFSVSAFNKFRQEIEELTQWKYSGEVELLITDATIRSENEKLPLDFSSCIICNLDAMLRMGAIESIRNFFEQIFRFSENDNPQFPVWQLSDKLGLSKTKSILKTFILKLLPKGLGTDTEKLAHLVIKDISKKDQT